MVKLLRTDTTLDLSQKARVVRNRSGHGLRYIATEVMRTDHAAGARRVELPAGGKDVSLLFLSMQPT